MDKIITLLATGTILVGFMSSSQYLHYIDTGYITPVHVLDAVAVDTNLVFWSWHFVS